MGVEHDKRAGGPKDGAGQGGSESPPGGQEHQVGDALGSITLQTAAGDPIVVQARVVGVAESPDTSRLIELLGHESQEVRTMAVAMLAQRGAIEAIPVLTERQNRVAPREADEIAKALVRLMGLLLPGVGSPVEAEDESGEGS